MSDCWYTPRNILDLVVQVLGEIDLDPCADDACHIAACQHLTVTDDGLSQYWAGRVFMNPPYSCPGKWVAKLQVEYESGRVSEAIALVPAATDTNWLSPLLESQPVCFWKGRIKFLDTNYQPKLSARQSHCFVYWGENWRRFKEIFAHGVVKMPDGKWNPADFGEVPYKSDGNQLTIFCEDTHEPPAPDDYPNTLSYEQAWAEWEKKLTRANTKSGVYITDRFESLGIIKENLGFGFVVNWLGIGTVPNPPSGKSLTYNWERDEERINTFSIAPSSLVRATEIKAITLHNPWAYLVGIYKFFETRDWATDYRGKIAIHAGKKQKDADYWCEQLKDLLPPIEELVFGSVVAIADLTDCIKMTPEFITQQSPLERRCGHWQPERYAWKLENIQILDQPIPAKGKQGLWNFSYQPEIDTQITSTFTVTDNKKENQQMTHFDSPQSKFQFSSTSAIASQIAQLQEQLNQLTLTLKPYQECEQKAEDLRRKVAEYGHEMTDRGILQNDILTWAKSLYSAASGVELSLGDSSAIAAQNQVIAELKTEIATVQKCEEKAIAQRNEAFMQLADIAKERDETLDKIADMTDGSLRIGEKLKTLQERHAQVLQEKQTDVATIEVLRKENMSLIARIQALEVLTDDMDAQLAEQQLMPEIEVLKQQVYELRLERDGQDPQLQSQITVALTNHQDFTKILNKGDIVQTPDNLVGTVTGFAYENVIVKLVSGEFQFQRKQLKWISTPDNDLGNRFHNFQEGDRVEVAESFEGIENLLHKQGVVVGVKNNSIAVLFDATDDCGQHETVLSASHLKAARHPDIEAQIKGRKFIASIKTKAGTNNITWANISVVCQSNPIILREIIHSATTKLQKDFVNIDNLARLMADYVGETGDITDFGWLDKTFVAKVEALLEAKKSLSYHPGDWVREMETGIVWQVRNFDGGWLSVQQDNKIASLHKSEVELVQQEAAA